MATVKVKRELRRRGLSSMMEYALVAGLVTLCAAAWLRSLHLNLDASFAHVTSTVALNVP